MPAFPVASSGLAPYSLVERSYLLASQYTATLELASFWAAFCEMGNTLCLTGALHNQNQVQSVPIFFHKALHPDTFAPSGTGLTGGRHGLNVHCVGEIREHHLHLGFDAQRLQHLWVTGVA